MSSEIILKRFTKLPIAKRVEELMICPEIIAECVRISKQNPPTTESLAGIAVERALLEYLAVLGAQVVLSTLWYYDAIVNGIMIDVKARLDGQRWQQTLKEAIKLKQTGDRVLYLCVDVSTDLEYTFSGCCWIEDLSTSLIGCPYVRDALSDLNLI